MTRYAIDITTIAPRAVIELRGDPAAALRCLAAAGLRAPSRANSIAAHPDGAEVLCLGPRRWLVMAPLLYETALAARLGEAAEGILAAVCVSDMWTGIALRGSGAPDVLAQGTPLDFEAERFPADAASFTDLFAVTALLRRAADGFEIWCDRSLARHITDSLHIAAGQPEPDGVT